VSIELTDAAKELVLTEGYDVNYGARPLRRALQRLVQDPLALKILDGDVITGDHVIVDAAPQKHEAVFRVEGKSAAKTPAPKAG
jgi:ATP-dependent Clp protease ATP-binding subunit ClpB